MSDSEAIERAKLFVLYYLTAKPLFSIRYKKVWWGTWSPGAEFA